jgi:hypothetical protein
MQIFNHLVGLEKKQRSKQSQVRYKAEKKVKIDFGGN